MAKSRIGHFYESKILEALQVRPPVDLPLDLLEPLRD
jgi:pyridoxal biosynthesis lyase PdxS